MNIEIRRVEPGDYKAVQQVHAQPNAIRGTLQLPFPSEEIWKERLAKSGDQHYGLVACVEGEIVGMLSLSPTATSPRRKHAAYLGMVVHDKWQSKGVGTALMKAAVDLADNWLDLSRLELTVYTDNEPAMRLYKKLGFRDGGYVDAYTMARVR
jgi:putative acetyltransferase